ncbi:hypothetical protein JST97_21570 [bacterium]|nr:hypothetical protein [bacterium]
MISCGFQKILSSPGFNALVTKLNFHIAHQTPKLPPQAKAPAAEQPATASEDTVELGAHKTVTQHLGNAGFGMSSVAAFGDGVSTLLNSAAQIPGAELVPGLNVGVAAVEGYNSIKKLKEHEPIVAATSAGNALGTLGTFLGQVAAGHALLGWHLGSNTALLAVGSVAGLVAGGLGIAAGVAEIKKGNETNSSRTKAMGCLDITSGVVSLAGAGAMAMGAAPLGVGLMMLSNLVDLAGIGVDYLWKKMHNRRAAEKAAAEEQSAPVPAQPADSVSDETAAIKK